MFALRKKSVILVCSILAPILLSAAPANAKTVLETDNSYEYLIRTGQTLNVSSASPAQKVSRDSVTLIEAPPSAPQTSSIKNFYTNQTYNGGSIVEFARQFIGLVPYVANAASPEKGFDCSGFTQYVFANAAGISLPHSSTAQGNMGTQINPADAQPGDLLIWSGHVAIYTGGGMMIDAAVPGTYISEKPIWGNPKYVRI